MKTCETLRRPPAVLAGSNSNVSGCILKEMVEMKGMAGMNL
jgi:hypothetical protein